MSEQEQKYCCFYFKNCRNSKTIKTKYEAFPEYQKWKDQEFFRLHPEFLMWVEDQDLRKSAWHWFHFCSNCGFKHSSDEQIEYWNRHFSGLKQIGQ